MPGHIFMSTQKVAILIDGGFIRKKIQRQNKRHVVVGDIKAYCDKLLQHERLNDCRLYRVLFYDAPPFTEKVINPIDRSHVDLGSTGIAKQNVALLDGLEMEPDFAVRRGVVILDGWKLGSAALKSISRNPRAVVAQDFVPDLSQKGVDLKIGLDVAWLALQKLVDVLVVVTGDF